MTDADAGLNGELGTVMITSAVGSKQRQATNSFRLVQTVLSRSQPRIAEYQLEVAQSLEDIGDHVRQLNNNIFIYYYFYG